MSTGTKIKDLHGSQRATFFGDACAAYCREDGRREIPDLVLTIFDRYVRAPRLPAMPEAIAKLREMVGRYEEMERLQAEQDKLYADLNDRQETLAI